ncbi:MAG: Gfo/Idh/MocA family oxidoreductase [Planctomycetes bacterium]|nr:Gfo/Idh/MocA family oxidoreductase [Planctomycetota bacterium]
MTSSLGRREFLQAAIAAGTAVAAGPLLTGSSTCAKEPRSANEKLNLAVIGVAARGEANLNGVSGENIAVLCDIDDRRLEEAGNKHPGARKVSDYRDVFETSNLDGIVCSTPDHMHAIIVAAALKQGLPVYCEKPLTHSVYEARVLRQLNAQANVPTQMGNQIHAGANYRRVVELVRSGAIGAIERVHVWQGGGVRSFPNVQTSAPPKHVHYDQWIGPAPFRPFSEAHFHFNWRYWWDFGGGQLGDFGCHFMDLPFWALELGAPTSVAATGEKGHDGDNDCPMRMRVEYKFPGRGGMPPVHLTWSHGGWMPKGSDVYQMGSAVLFEGTDGRLIADYGTHKLFMQEGRHPVAIRPWISDSVGGHHHEWLHAIRTNGTTSSHFEYAGNLTEAVLLGNVSYRSGKAFQWDAKAMKTDSPEADQYLKRNYRDGWTL